MIIPYFIIALVMILLLLIITLLLYLVMRTLDWVRIDLNHNLLLFIWTCCSGHICAQLSIFIIICIILCHHNHLIMHLYHTDPKLTQPFNLLSMHVRIMMMMMTIFTIIVNIFIYHCHDQYSMNWWLDLTPANWPSQTSALIFTIIPLIH